MTDADLHAERLFRRVRKAENGCWLWTGSLDTDGYGQIGVNKRHWKTHRLAWAIHNKREVPKGLCVCHRCDVRNCVNPAHLFVGTHSDNNRDRALKGRNGNGGARGPRNGAVKVKHIPRDEMVALFQAGRPCYEIGPMFGVSKSTAWNIISGNHWSNHDGL